ncbi:MAG: hypothetical protein WBA23_16820 [Tunicatimonas sp.]|uniref:hypothetical protein n=1 Tax=Tunicatimonas sp. TaxID=1940096 RepID=UPI003C748E8E
MNELLNNLAASLWMKPGQESDILSREAFRRRSPTGLTIALDTLVAEGMIYRRGTTYYCYKKTAIQLNRQEGYGLDLKEAAKPSEFRRAFQQVMKPYSK